MERSFLQKITIIIPVYNAEETLEETLDSILGQSYKNFEIVCVDDGSHDTSLSILNSYEQNNSPFIKVIKQKNSGVSIARNKGISNATGDIIMFADADDRLLPGALEQVATIFYKERPEIYTFGFICDPPEATPLGLEKELKPKDKLFLKFEPSLLFKEKARPYVWRTAFSKELIRRENLQFEPGISLGEDQIIYFIAYPLSHKTILSSNQLYVYNMRKNSATHSNAEEIHGANNRLDQHMAVIEAIMREWKERELDGSCRSELLDWMLDLVLFDINSLDNEKQELYYSRLIRSFVNYYKMDPIEVATKPATKNCLKEICQRLQETHSPKQKTFISLKSLALFYYSRYGFVRCLQQVLIGLGLLKKWR
jgi:glycosyltransferase EpsJ